MSCQNGDVRIGIFGGSFNPVHVGHLVVAERVAEALHLDRVLFIPTARTPLKEGGDLASPRHRWAMLRLALRGHPRFRAWDLEIRRGGVSYTVDTLRELRRRLKADLFLIVGADAMDLFPRWKAPGEVRRLATLVVATRPGHRPRRRMPKMIMVRVPLLEISGTEIRDRLRRGRSVRHLVPEAVERYLLRKRPYR